jgi:serine/threonine protein kinase
MSEPTRMTPERWRAVDSILRAALDREPGTRDAFIREACGTDDALRQEVASLLGAHDAMATNFLERPAVEEPGAPPVFVPNERMAAALASTLADQYAIEAEIAHGGMATVYRARDLRHERTVAVKVMRDEVAAAVGAERFLEEIRVTALLQHPHILPLFDSGSVGGRLWYVMPFVDGETLRSKLSRGGALPIDEAVRIAREIADALEHAHGHGIVHRDIKPENVLLHEGHALVADFGIALALEHAGGERLTRTGLTLGTPQYMAPEQAAGERALDARVDVYALGAVLYEMLAGAPPFVADSREAILRMLREPPAPLATLRPEVPAAVDAAVRRALAKRPAERYASAAALAAALDGSPDRIARAAVADSAERGGVPRVTPTPPKSLIRPRAAVYAAIAGVAVGLVSGWGLAQSSTVTGLLVGRPGNPPAIANADANVSDPVRLASNDAISLVVVDRTGRVLRGIDANRPWTPRFSPDGRRVAYGAFGAGRSTSDIWVTDLETSATRRLTDDAADSNDPQWSPDGKVVAFSVNAPGGKDIATRRLTDSAARVIASRNGTQFTSDWVHDGRAFIISDDAGGNGYDVLVQPADGSAPTPYVATAADETAARVSPDGRWIAYTSNASGRDEVYLDSYPRPTRRVQLSHSGGIHPVWRGDGKELYYWREDRLIAVPVSDGWDGAPPKLGAETVLFTAAYQANVNTMYDVSAKGDRFVIVTRSQPGRR